MDDLPATPATTTQPIATSPVGSTAKEVAPMRNAESPLIQEVGKEVALPPEVEHAGVRVKSDTIELPPRIQQSGVSAVGPAAPSTPQPPTVSLPLTDDQIAQGLSESIFSSIRWLAEWCERQLKSAHMVVKKIHGKTVRTSTE